MTNSRGFRPGGGFVELAVGAAASRGSFAPFGGTGPKPDRRSEFRPLHPSGAAEAPAFDVGGIDDLGDFDTTGGLGELAGNGGLDLGDLQDPDSPEPGGLEGLDDAGNFGGLAGEADLQGTDAEWPGTPDEETGLAPGDDILSGIGMGGGEETPSTDTGDERIAALMEQHARELEAVRAEWGETVAERISTGLKAIEQRVLDEIGTDVAQILAPILGEEARSSSVAAFVGALRELLADAGAVSVRVEGPPDLIERVQGALGSAGGNLEFKPSEQVELRAQLADSVITTRLGEWAGELAGAVHARP